jgi:hypothetical protein
MIFGSQPVRLSLNLWLLALSRERLVAISAGDLDASWPVTPASTASFNCRSAYLRARQRNCTVPPHAPAVYPMSGNLWSVRGQSVKPGSSLSAMRRQVIEAVRGKDVIATIHANDQGAGAVRTAFARLDLRRMTAQRTGTSRNEHTSDRVAKGLGGGAPANAGEGKGPHARRRRLGHRTPADAVGGAELPAGAAS